VGLEHDGVVGEHHHVGLDLLRHALGPRLRHLQPHRPRGVRRHGEHRRHQGEGQRRRHLGRSPRDIRLASLGMWGAVWTCWGRRNSEDDGKELRQPGLLSEFLRGVHVTWRHLCAMGHGKWDHVSSASSP
jgi:hypothetical protein